MVADVSEDAIRWMDAMRRAAREITDEQRDKVQSFAWFTDSWKAWDEDLRYLPKCWLDVVTGWDAVGVDQSTVLEAVEIALANRSVDASAVFAYARGVMRNRLADIAVRAQKIIEAGE